jgi:hypothetical protein
LAPVAVPLYATENGRTSTYCREESMLLAAANKKKIFYERKLTSLKYNFLCIKRRLPQRVCLLVTLNTFSLHTSFWAQPPAFDPNPSLIHQ